MSLTVKYCLTNALISSGILITCFLKTFAVLYSLKITTDGLYFLSIINKFFFSSSLSSYANFKNLISRRRNKYTLKAYKTLSSIVLSF